VATGTLRLCAARTKACKTVVFVSTCAAVDFLHLLVSRGFPAATGRTLLDGGGEGAASGAEAAVLLKLHGDMDAVSRKGAVSRDHITGTMVVPFLCR
jgi:superfamily II DNA/RNA helicase